MPSATHPITTPHAARPPDARSSGRRLKALALCIGLGIASSSGCASLGKPDWLEPGPARSQQRRAVRFDPYLEEDMLPSSLRLPLTDGLRPRDFAVPVPEVRRSRWWAPVQ